MIPPSTIFVLCVATSPFILLLLLMAWKNKRVGKETIFIGAKPFLVGNNNRVVKIPNIITNFLPPLILCIPILFKDSLAEKTMMLVPTTSLNKLLQVLWLIKFLAIGGFIAHGLMTELKQNKHYFPENATDIFE